MTEFKSKPKLPKILKILLVEDELETRTVMMRLLSHHGHEIQSAFNAPSAIALLGAETFDLVLLDIILGSRKEMTGWAVASYMRATPRLRDVPVFVISGLDPAEIRRGAMSYANDLSGTALIFSKPVDADELLAAIQRVHLRDR